MEFINYENEIARKTKWDGYYTTKSGKILSVKVRGGQGRLDYDNPKELAYKKDRYGYLVVTISTKVENKTKNIYPFVHRIVWETFNGEILNDLTIDHINENSLDNRLENLQLMSREDNGRKAKLGKPSTRKGKTFREESNLFKLFINNELQGEFTRNELESNYDIKKWDFEQCIYKSKLTNKLKKRNITLERM